MSVDAWSHRGERAWGWSAGLSTVLLVAALFSVAGDGAAMVTAVVGVGGFLVVLPAVLLATRGAPDSPFPPVRTVAAGAFATVVVVLTVTSPLWRNDPWPAVPITVGLGLPIAAIPVFVGGLVARHTPHGLAVALTVAGLAATVWAVAALAF